MGFLGWARNLGVQWVSLLCVVNGRSLDVKCVCPIKSDPNFVIYKFLLVGFCCFGPVYGWCYAAGKGAVYKGFRGRLLCSPLCVLYIDGTGTFSYGRDFSDQIGERSEGQLCGPLKWFDGGGGKWLLGSLVLAQCGLLCFCPNMEEIGLLFEA